MTNEEILKKAYARAHANGYKIPEGFDCGSYIYPSGVNSIEISTEDGTSIEAVIFSHDFAKAFWGEEWVDKDFGNSYKEYKQTIKNGAKYPQGYEWREWDLRWGFRLKGMVLSEDPIRYLEQFIN